ncbi:hypothetical protein ACOME3_008175 [Neoechinorhynchus agilis]
MKPEVVDELLVLESMFDSDFKRRPDSEKGEPQLTIIVHEKDSGSGNVSIDIVLPDGYPTESAAIVTDIRLSPNDLLQDHEFFALKRSAETIGRKYLGHEAVYQICSDIEDMFIHKRFQIEAVKEEERIRKSEEEQRQAMLKFEGTRVTAETFNAWNEQFLAELKGSESLSSSKSAEFERRLTGRQLFEQHLVIEEEEDIDIKEGEDLIFDEDDDLDVDESLFVDDIDAFE